MQSKNTDTTAALSVSRTLPDGCVAYRNGLQLPDNLTHEDWVRVGSQVTQLARASMWLIGDWLAYGQSHYHGKPGFERMANDVYAKVAEDSGFAEGTLRNAKCVCAAVNLSRRHDKLTFTHAQEIVGRAPAAQLDYWIKRAVGDGLSTRRLREELRKAKSQHRLEPNDTGTTTDIEWLRQVERDFLFKARTWNPAMKREAATILGKMARAIG